MRKLTSLVFICFLGVIVFAGCSKKNDKPPVLSEANEKFLTTLKEEHGYEKIQVRQVGQSLWIYLPMEERIIDLKSYA